MKKNNFLNKFVHTIYSCYLCARFPFLYPRNRFTGRHMTRLLYPIIHNYWKKAVTEISINGELSNNSTLRYSNHFNILDIKINIDKEKNTISIWNDINRKDLDISKLIYNNEKFEVLGAYITFSFTGNPIIRIHVKTKDVNDTTNYGFVYHRVELIKNKHYYRLYKFFKWIDENILDRILFIPTYNELDAMEPGWRKAFGIQMCKEIKQQLKKEHRLYSYRIMQIKEKFGRLCWYDNGYTTELYDIINKYDNLSWETCLVCGKPATKITSGWISPYCDDCFPKDRIPYLEKVDGSWQETKKYQDSEREFEKYLADAKDKKEI